MEKHPNWGAEATLGYLVFVRNVLFLPWFDGNRVSKENSEDFFKGIKDHLGWLEKWKEWTEQRGERKNFLTHDQDMFVTNVVYALEGFCNEVFKRDENRKVLVPRGKKYILWPMDIMTNLKKETHSFFLSFSAQTYHSKLFGDGVFYYQTRFPTTIR